MCVCVCVCVCVCLSDFAEVLFLSSILESQQIISEVEKSQEIICYLEMWKKIGEGEIAESHCLQAAGITAKRWMMWAEDHCSSSLNAELQRFHEV